MLVNILVKSVSIQTYIHTYLWDYSKKLAEKLLKVLFHLLMTVKVVQLIAMHANTHTHTHPFSHIQSRKVRKMPDMPGNCEHFHPYIYVCMYSFHPLPERSPSAGSAGRLNVAKSFPSACCKVFHHFAHHFCQLSFNWNGLRLVPRGPVWILIGSF